MYHPNHFPVERASRRHTFAEEDCIFANWLRHCRPRAGRWNTACRMLCIRRKQEKNPEEKQAFPAGFFHCFHSARGLSFRFPQATCGKRLFIQFSQSQNGCRANSPAAGGTGGEKPPASLFLMQHAERRLEKQSSASQNGSRGDTPGAARVRGPRRPLLRYSTNTAAYQFCSSLSGSLRVPMGRPNWRTVLNTSMPTLWKAGRA